MMMKSKTWTWEVTSCAEVITVGMKGSSTSNLKTAIIEPIDQRAIERECPLIQLCWYDASIRFQYIFIGNWVFEQIF